MNKVILSGFVGKCEVRVMSNGGHVANLSVATRESYKDKNGEYKDITDWHRVVIYGKLAERADTRFQVGTQVELEGKLKTRKWQDQAGNDRFQTEVLIQGFGSTITVIRAASNNSQQPQQPQQQGQQSSQQHEHEEDVYSSIPF